MIIFNLKVNSASAAEAKNNFKYTIDVLFVLYVWDEENKYMSLMKKQKKQFYKRIV